MLTTQCSGASISANPFVETTLSYALTYIARAARQGPTQSSIRPTRLTVLADNDYYSNSGFVNAAPGARFARFGARLSDAHKTGLGSSAALVTALTAAILTHYLDPTLFDPSADAGRTTLHNLAQAAHCAAQGKVGSGFDVAAAVYGSCRYRRFSPNVLAGLPEPGTPGFAARLDAVIGGGGNTKWDNEVVKDGVSLPPGVAVRMCDVDCGSQTVGMVKKVLAWRAGDEVTAKALWDDLQRRNEALAQVLREGRAGDIREAVRSVRELVRKMGTESGVPIEPESQTALLDALEGVEGVYGGVVPGAGGFDAVALLLKDDGETLARLEKFLDDWGKTKDGKVTLLGVKGEMEGARVEKLDAYDGWF